MTKIKVENKDRKKTVRVTKKSLMSERTKSDITEQAEPLEFVQQDSENRILHLEQAVDNLKESFSILALGASSQKELDELLRRVGDLETQFAAIKLLYKMESDRTRGKMHRGTNKLAVAVIIATIASVVGCVV